MFKYTFCLLNILIGAWASQESFDLAINARVSLTPRRCSSEGKVSLALDHGAGRGASRRCNAIIRLCFSATTSHPKQHD
jgi:hypothetical protein